MFSIIEHIEYLLTRHDCVVIPDWGAFIANYSSSSYDEEHEVMTRPLRSIGFNPSVIHNDGLLVQSLMRRESMTYDQAMRFIADSVASFRKQLNRGGEVSMGLLGHFRSSEGRNVEFVPSSYDNATDQFYGLADVDIKTVEMLEREQAEREVAEAPAAIVPERRNLFSRRGTRIAASVAVLIGLGIVLTTPIIVNRDQPAMASMAPTVTGPQTQHLSSVTVQQGVVPQAFQIVESNPALAAVGNTAGKYYMVIATLRDQQELDAFKNKYSALVPYMKMLDYKGMTCVYVARSDDYNQLMGLRDELPEPLRDIWIYN